MRNNTDGTFLDGDGRARGPADRPASARVDVVWPTSEAAGQLAEKVGTPAHREAPR